MSKVDYDTFLQWAVDRFGGDNIRIQKDEIKTHSVFADDQKFHLWMNPSGGKSDHPEFGSYRCWYTDRKGSLVSLVAYVDNVPYEEAEELICGVSSLRALEKKLDEFFQVKEDEYIVVNENVNVGLELPPHTFGLSEISSYNKYRIDATRYLKERKIPTDDLFVCIGGDYKNRIIIPYYNADKKLVYYNARTLSDKDYVLRYKKPDSSEYKQEHVLFLRTWPHKGSKIYITEGEFDAISLNVSGLYGAGCGGKTLSDQQMEMIRLRGYVPVLAMDRDEGKKKDSGMEATINIGNKLLEHGFKEVFYVRPPSGYKDWNDLLKRKNETIVKKYIDQYERPYTTSTAHNFMINNL